VHALSPTLVLRGSEGVGSNGNSEGLAFFWHENLNVDVKEANERYIDAHIAGGNGCLTRRLTHVYDEPRRRIGAICGHSCMTLRSFWIYLGLW
jgi:hypothetical protein